MRTNQMKDQELVLNLNTKKYGYNKFWQTIA
jgi:hypothetical protein